MVKAPKTILFVLLILFLGAFAVYLKTKKPETVSSSVLSVIDKCRKSTDTLNSLDPDCVFSRFQSIITKENLGEAVSAMESLYSSERDSKKLGVPSCHIPAHIAGEVAYQKGVTFNEVLNTCGQMCGFGCLHGAFQGMFKESGESFIGNLAGSCSLLENPTDDDIRACWHIVGHGVGEYFGRDLEGAISACTGLPEEKQRWHCISGLRMEHVTPSPWNHESVLTPTAEGYLDFCTRFPKEEGFQDDCYAEGGFATLKIFANVEAATEICRKVPNDPIVKKRCAGGAGTVFYFAHKDNPAVIYDFCKKYEEEGMVNDCILGAIEIVATEWSFKDTAPALCRLADRDFTRECFSFYGEKIERWNGSEKRQERCGEFANPEKSYCLDKPQDSRDYYLPPD